MEKKIVVGLGIVIAVIACVAVAAFYIVPEHLAPEPREPLRLATTTSLYDTGLLRHLEPIFEERYNLDLHIISAGTGRAIRHAKDGDVCVLLVHERGLEDAFVDAGYGINRRCIAYNHFLIIGPSGDPANARNMTPADALAKIKEAGMQDPGQVRFVSRGDDSGTHLREIAIWTAGGHDYAVDIRGRAGAWYIEAGAGMGATLRMANEKSAYTLVDIGTFLAFVGKLDLVPIVEEGEGLLNPYGVIAVNPEKHPHVNIEMANAFIAFLMSDEIQREIHEFRVEEHGGRHLFYRIAGRCEEIGCPTSELCKKPPAA